jgi:hypothetical protein
MRKLLTEACLSLLMLETVVEEEEEISEVAGFVATKLLIVGSCENANTRAVGHAHVITHSLLCTDSTRVKTRRRKGVYVITDIVSLANVFSDLSFPPHPGHRDTCISYHRLIWSRHHARNC